MRPRFAATKKATHRGCIFFAEREGFEPPVPLGTVVFKTTVIDHSTISPVLRCLESGCKGKKIFRNEQIFSQLFFVFPLHFAHLFVPLPSVMAKALPFEFSQIHLENPSLIRTFEATARRYSRSDFLKYIWKIPHLFVPLQRDLS